MQRIAIERRSGLSHDEFTAEYVANGGKPVVITDAVERWPAATKWTFEHFKATYGNDFTYARPSLMSRSAKVTRLSEYLDSLDARMSPGGIWVDIDTGKPVADAPGDDVPLYMLGWSAFERHPELFQDIQPPPAFVDDWVCALDPATRLRLEDAAGILFWTIFVGPEGSLSQLHHDFGHTYSFLAQIQGRKQATLFAPSDAARLYKCKVDPENPDLAKFPLYEEATAYECVIEPGELLFTPPDWFHHVRGLTKTITVSHNFFNASNFGAYFDFITPLMRDKK